MSDIEIRDDAGLPALLDMVEQVEAQVAVVTTREEIESGLALVAALETKAKLQGVADIGRRLSAAGLDLKRKLGALLKEKPAGRPNKESSPASDDLSRDDRYKLRTLAAVPEAIVEAEKRKAEAEGRPVSVSRVMRAHRRAEPVEPPPMPTGRYGVVYADPPWRYEHAEADNREIENQYPTMGLDEIKALDVPAADDCVLFLWATSPKLAEAMDVVEAWGFSYRTCAVWVKDRIGMGYYFRQRHELLLVAARGRPGTPATADRVDSVFEAPRGTHSAKPVSVREAIEVMYPGHPKIELFAREAPAGWAVWGHEA